MCRVFHAFFRCFANIAHFFGLSTLPAVSFCGRAKNSQNVPDRISALTNVSMVQYACLREHQGIQILRGERTIMKYFFWIAFAVFLAASIPHVAYFFASFEPSQGPEGVWWWAVSYAIAISIDVTVYLLSWTAFQRYRRYRTAKAVWQHWLLIVMCTVFSWAVNWAYAKQFHSTT